MSQSGEKSGFMKLRSNERIQQIIRQDIGKVEDHIAEPRCHHQKSQAGRHDHEIDCYFYSFSTSWDVYCVRATTLRTETDH